MTAPQYDQTIPAPGHGGRFNPDPPAIDVVHSTEGPMSAGNAAALARNWFGRPQSAGGAGTSTTGIFDPAGSVRMLDEHTVPYHVGPAGNGLATGDEHCGSVNLTAAQWMSAAGQAMLDASAKVKAQRAHYRGWSLADCRWLSLTEVARRTVRGFCTHNDIRLALGGTTHSDPGPNFPYAWYMSRVRFWYANPNGTPQEADMSPDECMAVLKDFFNMPHGLNVPAGKGNNDDAYVTLLGLAQTGFNADGAIRSAVAAVKADTAVTGANESAILAKLAEVEALLPAPAPTPGA